MDHKHARTKYRAWYQKLLRLYPKSYREKFEGSMMQTFDDLAAEKSPGKSANTFGFILRMFGDTSAGILKEYLTLISKTMKITPVAIIGFVFIIPFSVLVGIGIAWQILHHFGLAGSPYLAEFIPNKTVGYAIFFTLPIIAFLINATALFAGIAKTGLGSAFSIKFAKTNFFALAVTGLSAGAMFFVFGHDAIPCLVHNVVKEGISNIRPLIETCSRA